MFEYIRRAAFPCDYIVWIIIFYAMLMSCHHLFFARTSTTGNCNERRKGSWNRKATYYSWVKKWVTHLNFTSVIQGEVTAGKNGCVQYHYLGHEAFPTIRRWPEWYLYTTSSNVPPLFMFWLQAIYPVVVPCFTSLDLNNLLYSRCNTT